MSTSKRLTLFCVLSLLSLLLEPLQAYGVSPFSGLKMDNSLSPGGAKVFAVKEDSPASQSGIQVNDVITSIEGHAISSIDDFARVSQWLKDKENVLLTVNRGGEILEITLGKKSVVEQAKPETRVQAEPQPKRVEVKTVQKGFENPVVPNATGITYRHGQYPSEGNNTHPGIDIVADCGSPICSFADGEVKELIKDEKDRNFNSLGYMVIIKHQEPINNKDTYSIYLHMKEPPAVSKGQTVKAGDVIGKVGDTGNAKGCHVHFELRHFPDRFLNDKSWNYPLNIYGKGDQRNEKRFLENWEDPEVYFRKYPGGIVSQEKRPQPKAPRVAEGERIEDYFPIQDGARWQYNVEVESPKKTLFGTQYSKSTSVITVECKEGMNFQGQEAVMLLEDRGDYQIKRYYRKESDALLELGYEFVSAKEQIYHALVPPVPLLRQPVRPPMNWEIPTSMVGPKGTETSFKYRINVGDGGRITVPAGHFETIKVVSLTFGEDTEWYAKGTGLVKKVETLEVKEQGGKQTTKYELVSYSLGGLLVSKTVEENTKSETEVKQKAGVTTPKKGDSLLDDEKWKERRYQWVYTDPETGVRYAEQSTIFFGPSPVIGEVPESIDLTDHQVAKELLIKGKNAWLYHAVLYLPYYGDGVKVLLFREPFTSKAEADVSGLFTGKMRGEPLEGHRRIQTRVGWVRYISGFESVESYENELAKKVQRAKALKDGEEKAVYLIRALINSCKIEAAVTSDRLYSNPYIYKGKTLITALEFERMLSEDVASFSGFKVSKVPTDFSVRLDTSPILVVRVLVVKGEPQLQFLEYLRKDDFKSLVDYLQLSYTEKLQREVDEGKRNFGLSESLDFSLRLRDKSFWATYLLSYIEKYFLKE